MKRVFLLVFVMCLTVSLYASKTNAGELKQGDYLEKNQWGALEDILSDWKTGVLTTDECVIYGCYVLAAQEPARTDRSDKTKLIPSKYRLGKKSMESGPYFFVYQIYKNEATLGQKALDEFKNSDWCDEDFINEITSNNKVDEELHNLYSLSQQNIDKNIDKGNDTLNVLKYLAEQNTISYDSVYIAATLLYDDFNRFNKKFALFKDKYKLKHISGHFSFTSNIFLKIKKTKNRKSTNIVNFRSKYQTLMKKYGCKSREYYKNGFNVWGGENDYDNKQYCDLINSLYEKICSPNGFKKPINFYFDNTLEIGLRYGNAPESGSTVFFLNSNGVCDKAKITLFIDRMKQDQEKNNIAISKTIIHELFHSIQYSYSDENKKNYWFIDSPPDNPAKFFDKIADSTAVWAEDFFYDSDGLYKKYLSTIFDSRQYFFNIDNEGNIISYEFPGNGFYVGNGYCMGFFWNYICNLHDNDSIKKLLELFISQIPLNALKTFSGGEKNFLDSLHHFGTDNFLLTKQKGIIPYEDEFTKAADNWKPLPIFKIMDDKLKEHYTVFKGQTQSFGFTLNPLSTHFIRIDPEKFYFENSTFINFKLKDLTSVSVITIWTDVNNDDNAIGNPKYLRTDLETLNNNAIFRYYTKKGINPKYFIIAITNGNLDYTTVSIEITLDKPANLSNTISNAGQNYNNDIFSFFSKGVINNVKDFDSEIATLYVQYKSDTSNQFYGNQLYQKIVDLNLYMQTTLNQIHDLRYQYYLAKSEIVNSIMEGATSSSIKNQILRYCDFVKKMAKIIDANTNSIDVFNGWVVMYHVDNKLKTTKAPANWTDEEYGSFDKESNAAMKKISSAFSNSKYEYKYTNEQIKDSVSVPMVGMPAIEIPGPIVNPAPAPIIPGPFMVNFCPNIEKKLAAAVPVSHKFSDLIFKGFDFVANGKPYNSKGLLCISDTFSPLSLKYFSSIAVHAYHEDNMPPQPAVSNVKGYVSSLGFYMKVCKDHASDTNTTDAFFNTKDIMIGGASKRITEIICLLAEAIMQELKNGKNDIYTALNKELALVPYKDEVLDLLEKQLKKDGYRE